MVSFLFVPLILKLELSRQKALVWGLVMSRETIYLGQSRVRDSRGFKFPGFSNIVLLSLLSPPGIACSTLSVSGAREKKKDASERNNTQALSLVSSFARVVCLRALY